jgi:hypothetical protein
MGSYAIKMGVPEIGALSCSGSNNSHTYLMLDFSMMMMVFLMPTLKSTVQKYKDEHQPFEGDEY